MVAEYFNTPLSLLDRLSRQIINKETSEFKKNYRSNRQNSIYRIVSSGIEQYALYSAAHETFSKIDQV
jgi:hypothetical protein